MFENYMRHEQNYAPGQKPSKSDIDKSSAKINSLHTWLIVCACQISMFSAYFSFTDNMTHYDLPQLWNMIMVVLNVTDKFYI